jgi:NAD(P)-dependent dehydrogenase (short-subunit alcohol dehydrogenase family)
VDYPEETFDRVLAVNVKGVWLGIKTVAPLLRTRGGGVIVNTASIAGLRGSRNLVAYTASKHAVVGLTRTAAEERETHHRILNSLGFPLRTVIAIRPARGTTTNENTMGAAMSAMNRTTMKPKSVPSLAAMSALEQRARSSIHSPTTVNRTMALPSLPLRPTRVHGVGEADG